MVDSLAQKERVRKNKSLKGRLTIFEALFSKFGKKSGKTRQFSNLDLSLFNIAIIFLLGVGSVTLIWVGSLVWNDIAFWSKEFSEIFLGSRVGENISLGIDLRVIHYYMIGILLIAVAIVLLIWKRWEKSRRKSPKGWGKLGFRK